MFWFLFCCSQCFSILCRVALDGNPESPSSSSIISPLSRGSYRPLPFREWFSVWNSKSNHPIVISPLTLQHTAGIVAMLPSAARTSHPILKSFIRLTWRNLNQTSLHYATPPPRSFATELLSLSNNSPRQMLSPNRQATVLFKQLLSLSLFAVCQRSPKPPWPKLFHEQN